MLCKRCKPVNHYKVSEERIQSTQFLSFVSCHANPYIALSFASHCILCQHSLQFAACRIHTTARELPMKRVAIQLTIASNLPWPVTLTTLTLTPQHGFRLDPPSGLVKSLCPLILNPSSTASALLFVSSKPGGRSASRGNMLRGGAGQGTELPLCTILRLIVHPFVCSFPHSYIDCSFHPSNHSIFDDSLLPPSIHPAIHACMYPFIRSFFIYFSLILDHLLVHVSHPVPS